MSDHMNEAAEAQQTVFTAQNTATEAQNAAPEAPTATEGSAPQQTAEQPTVARQLTEAALHTAPKFVTPYVIQKGSKSFRLSAEAEATICDDLLHIRCTVDDHDILLSAEELLNLSTLAAIMIQKEFDRLNEKINAANTILNV